MSGQLIKVGMTYEHLTYHDMLYDLIEKLISSESGILN